MGQNSFVTGMTLAVLFSICIFAFANGFAADNDGVLDIENRTQATDNAISGNMTLYVADASDNQEAFTEYAISTGSEAHETGEFFKGESASVKFSLTSIFDLAKKEIFGGDENFKIIFGILGALLAFIAATLAWKAWYGGNPE